MKKRLLAILLGTAMVFGLAACGNSGTSGDTGNAAAGGENTSAAEESGGTSAVDTANASYTIRIGMPTAGKHFQNYTAEQFEAAVEEATNGDIAVEIYPSSQLGTATQMIQGVQDGSIEAIIIPSSYFSSFAPATAVTDIPFLFEDVEQIFEIMNSEENPLNEYLETYGFKVAGWLKNTPRYILAQDKYESMADMSNQKIWCLPCTALQDELTAYGAAPQTLDPSDIAVSLENGTVDAAETDIIFMNSQGLGESANYLNEVPGTPMTNLFCFSIDWFESLPEDYQNLLLDTATDIIQNMEADYVDQMYEASRTALEEAGVEFVEPSDAFIEELKAASQSVTDTFTSENDKNAEIYEKLSELVQQ